MSDLSPTARILELPNASVFAFRSPLENHQSRISTMNL